MRNFKLNYRILFILVFGLQFFQCEKTEKTDLEESIKIGIVNPGAGSLQTFKNLVENHILNVPNLKFVAINYSRAERDIEKVKKYLENDDSNLFMMSQIDGEINLTNLFTKNDLSSQFKKIIESTDGIIFLGGADFPPAVYHAKTSLMTNISTPYRHYFELSFLFHLLGGSQDPDFIPLLADNPEYPVIGFCLGMQSINVATGGSMYQDIPTDIYGLHYIEDVLSLDPNQRHLNYWERLNPNDKIIWVSFHQIKPVKQHSFFNPVIWSPNPTPRVYSSHHQAIRELGHHLEVIATSMDEKVVEIIAHTDYKNVIGVQFHPEVSSLYDTNGKKYYWSPADTIQISYYEFLQNENSLQFHRQFWDKVAQTFSSQKKEYTGPNP